MRSMKVVGAALSLWCLLGGCSFEKEGGGDRDLAVGGDSDGGAPDGGAPDGDAPDDASSGDGASAPLETVSFQASDEDFPNPERGFHGNLDVGGDPDPIRQRGLSLVRVYVRLDPYLASDLPADFLQSVEASLGQLRTAGLKVILRFTYNFPSSYPNSDPDAPKARVLAHIAQLQPLFAANADVIAVLQAGFIGNWGEWHDSTNGFDTDQAAKNEVATALLTALPQSRMIQLRYPNDLESLIGAPVSAEAAFQGSAAARVGFHNDCFLDGDSDGGTWGRTGQGAGASVSAGKAYIEQQGRYTPVGGETCAVSAPRSECATAVDELQRQHYSYLNADFEPNVIASWKSGGCYDQISRQLGYRFVLSKASYTGAVQPGGALELRVELTNVGWAALYNPRTIYAVLDGPARYALPLADDPRRFAPGAPVVLTAHLSVPADAPSGTYRLSLWLPDPDARNAARPELAVRFANTGTWDATTGTSTIGSVLVGE